jgi:periplasmic divalent cation tolerance protein
MANNPGEVEFVQVATTFDAVEEAEALASSAVQARLAACAQSEGPVISVYWWDGAMQRGKEWRVTFKTTAALADRLIEHIVREHSYDVPEVLVTPVIGGHQKYLEWVRSETQQEGPGA